MCSVIIFRGDLICEMIAHQRWRKFQTTAKILPIFNLNLKKVKPRIIQEILFTQNLYRAKMSDLQ